MGVGPGFLENWRLPLPAEHGGFPKLVYRAATIIELAGWPLSRLGDGEAERVLRDNRLMADEHDQSVTHRYTVHYPAHPAREDDPHYTDFNHIRRAWKKDPDKWRCAVGAHRGDFSECDQEHPLELHHAHVEFSLQNGVDLAWLEKDYPGISDPDQVGAWVESADNLLVLCQFHHRGHGGVHVASSSDFEAAKYVRGLIG